MYSVKDKMTSSLLYLSTPCWHHRWLIFFFLKVPHTTPFLKYQNSPSGKKREMLDGSELSQIRNKKPKTLEKTRKTDYMFHLEISETWVGRVKDVMSQLHCEESVTDAGNGSNEEKGRRRLNQVAIHNNAFCNVSWIAEIPSPPFDSGFAIQKMTSFFWGERWNSYRGGV